MTSITEQHSAFMEQHEHSMTIYDLLLVCHCRYSCTLYHFRVIWHWV